MTGNPTGSWAAPLAALLLLAVACGEPDTAATPRTESTASSAAPSDSAIVIRRALTAPRIDGEVDAAWDGARGLPLLVSVVGTPGGEGDLTGEFFTLYDDDHLYLLFTVTDDVRRSDSSLPFEDDAVEVYIDGGYERAPYFDRNDWQFVFGRDERWWATGGQTDQHPNMRFASGETEGGYRVEIAIPWTGLGVVAEEGSAIGLETRVDDDDDGDGVDAVLAWKADGPTYEDASLMGVAVLGGTESGVTSVLAPPAAAGVSAGISAGPDSRSLRAEPPGQEAVNRLTEREEGVGFELLFDGASIERWRGYRADSVPGSWRVDGAALAVEPTEDGGDLISRETFADFELTLEWMVSEGGNSGVFYRVTENHDAAWETGPEMQVLDNARHPDGRNPLTSAGSNFGVYAPTADVARPAGEWNRAAILVNGDRVTHWLNDVPVVSYRLWSDDWEERVEKSKFGRMPDYGRAREGHIVLQDHGDRVWYRNIKIRRLPEQPEFSLQGMRILVFHETAGFRHRGIRKGVSALRELGEEYGFQVDATDTSDDFTRDGLAGYDAVVFLNTTGDVLDEAEQEAFEAYIRHGGGFVGIHAATDTEYEWPWYGGLVGAYYSDHASMQPARIYIVETDHPATRHLPASWVRTDEWYDFRQDPSETVTVLMELDETSYRGGSMGERHPIAWYHDFDGGRSFYTGLGHRPDAFADRLFLRHLLGGMVWAAGRDTVPAGSAGRDTVPAGSGARDRSIVGDAV